MRARWGSIASDTCLGITGSGFGLMDMMATLNEFFLRGGFKNLNSPKAIKLNRYLMNW